MVFHGFLIMSISWLLRFLILVTFLFSAWTSAVLAASAMILTDLVFLWRPLTKFSRVRLLRYFVFFELYLTFYALLIPFVAIASRKVVWKERRL